MSRTLKSWTAGKKEKNPSKNALIEQETYNLHCSLLFQVQNNTQNKIGEIVTFRTVSLFKQKHFYVLRKNVEKKSSQKSWKLPELNFGIRQTTNFCQIQRSGKSQDY